MSNKKVILLVPNFSNGGVQRVMLNLEKGLSSLGFETKFIVSNNKGEFSEQVIQSKIYNCDIKFGKGDMLPFLSFFKTITYIKEFKPDVIIAPPGVFTLVNIFYKYIFNKRIKSLNIVDNKISLLRDGKWYHKGSYYLFKLFYPYADYTIAAHEEAKKDLLSFKRISKDKIVKIYHPLIDTENTKEYPKVLKNKANKKYKIIGVGRLVKEKDFPNLIEAFSKIYRELNAELFILGEGPERKKIEQLISDKELDSYIHLVGYVKNPLDYIASSDLFVLSSSQEAFGNVIVEALSVGTKVVATNCESGGPSEILLKGKYGLLCEVGNNTQLANKIKEAYFENENYSELVERAEEFSIEKSAKKYGELINE